MMKPAIGAVLTIPLITVLVSACAGPPRTISGICTVYH